MLALVLLESERHRFVKGWHKRDADLVHLLSLNNILHVNTAVAQVATSLLRSPTSKDLKSDRARPRAMLRRSCHRLAENVVPAGGCRVRLQPRLSRNIVHYRVISLDS